MATRVQCILTVLIICGLFCIITGIPTPDEERYLDKEYNRELIKWLAALQNQYPDQITNPCKYHSTMPKRNSELINSLLSLPKNMNDAGK